MEQTQLDYLFYLIVHLKKMYNGLNKEWFLRINFYKNYGAEVAASPGINFKEIDIYGRESLKDIENKCKNL